MATTSGKTFMRRILDVGNAYGQRPDSFLDRAVGRLRRPLDRLHIAHHGALADQRRLGAAVAAAAPAGGSPRVLVLCLRSWVTHSAYEAVIAQALRLRGAEVALVSCGGGQPVCEMGYARRAYPRPCDRCGYHTDRVIEAARLPAYRLRDDFAWGADAPRAPERGEGDPEAPGDPAAISLRWFLRTSRPEVAPEGREIADAYSAATSAVGAAAERILDDFRPDVVFMLSGLFASEAVIRQKALARGIRTTTYEMAPHGMGIVLSNDAPAPTFDMDAGWQRFGGHSLSPAEEERLTALLDDRSRSVGVPDAQFRAPAGREAALRAELGLDAGAPLVSLFTNMSYDSATLFKEVAFESMVDWAVAAARSAGERGVSLVIRIHPAEARWGTQEDVAAAIRAQLGAVPASVRIVPAESRVNSYDILHASDRVLVYASTVGLEAAARGMPVAVAARTHYRGRGFTFDLETPADLGPFLDPVPPAMAPEQIDLARRYAHMFFFRVPVPFPPVDRRGNSVHSVATSPAALAPGADPHVDFVCERILRGGDFLLPDELGPGSAA